MRKARALRTIRRLKAAEAEVSAWEGAFLDSVEGRLDTYGRAFADPQKGARESALSALQQRKLKEIGAKVAGDEGATRPPKARAAMQRKPWGRKTPLSQARRTPRDDDET